MTELISTQETPRIMSVAEIVALCKCSQGKVSLYFSKHNIQPVAYRHEQFHNVKLYELTDDLERHFKTVHKTGPIPAKEKTMVTTANPPPKGDRITIKSKTIKETADYCGCSTTKVATYIRKHNIQPVGAHWDRFHKSINLYNFTAEQEQYFRVIHHGQPPRQQSEAERILSGWLTVREIAERWKCGYNKALDLLHESNAPYRWETKKEGWGRKFYKIPAKPSRDPQAYKTKQKSEGDWLASVTSKEVRDMVLDERKWRGMIGKRVAVELKKYDQRIEGVLKQYSMCWFIIKRDNGRMETYKHREAKVVEEVK